MYVAPTDLGPHYKIVFKAYVYVLEVKRNNPFVMPSINLLKDISMTIYYHNELQAVDTDKPVSKDITIPIWNAADGALKDVFRGSVKQREEKVIFPRLTKELIKWYPWY